MAFGAADASIFIQIVGDDSRLNKALNRSKKDMRQWGREITSLGSSLSFNPVTAGMAMVSTIAAKSYADYEKHLNRVQAVTGAVVGQMGRLSSQAMELGKTTIFSAHQAAEGMAFLGMAGFDANEVLKAMPGVTKLAAIGMTDVSKAADIATNILLGFGLEVDNISRVNDVMAAAITDSNTDLRKMGSALSYAAPLAKAAGWSLEEVTAAIMSVSDAGIQGTRAGTSIRNMIMRLTKPSAKAAEIMKFLGISVLDTSGNLKDMDKIVEEFSPHMEKAGEMAAIFGARAAPGMLKILRSGVGDFRDDLGGLITSFGQADEMSDVMVQGFYGAVVRLKSAVSTMFIEIGSAQSGAMADIANYITGTLIPALSDVVKWFGEMPKPVQFASLAMGGFLASIGPILWTLGPMVTALTYLNDTFVVTAIRAKALRLIFNPLVGGFSQLTRAITGIGGITIASALFDDLRARMGGVGKEAVQVAGKMGIVTQAVTGVGLAAANIGFLPNLTKRMNLKPPTNAGFGLRQSIFKPPKRDLIKGSLFDKDQSYFGSKVKFSTHGQTLTGKQFKDMASGVNILNTYEKAAARTTATSRSLNEVTLKSGNVFRVAGSNAGKLRATYAGMAADTVKGARAGIGIGAAFSAAARKLVSFRVGMGATGLAITAASLISKDFAKVIDESFGIGLGIVKVFGLSIGGMAVNIANNFLSLGDAIGSFFTSIDEGISDSPVGGFLQGLAGHLEVVGDMLSLINLSDFSSFDKKAPLSERFTKANSPEVGQPEGWGDRPERGYTRTKTIHAERKYDFGNFSKSLAEIGASVRTAEAEFLRGEISVADYERALSDLAAGNKGRDFSKWMKGGSRAIEDQVKWLENYGRAIEDTIESLSSIEKYRIDLSQHFGGDEALDAYTAIQDHIKQRRSRDYEEHLRKEKEYAEQILRGKVNLYSGIYGQFLEHQNKMKQITPDLDSRVITPGVNLGTIETSGSSDPGLVLPDIIPTIDTNEAEKETDHFSQLLDDLSNSARNMGGEVAGAFANMAQVAITSFRAMGEGIKSAEMASIILAVIHGVYELAKALGAGAVTAEEITNALADTSIALDNVRSGAYTTAEALDYMANWSGNQEGFDFLRNVQQDARDAGVAIDYATDLVDTMWEAMRRMDDVKVGSEEWVKAKEDYDQASIALVNLAAAGQAAREQIEQLNLMTGTLSEEAVENLEKVATAYYSLDEATQNTALATKIYAEALIDAQKAGKKLTDQEQKIVDKHRQHEAAIDNLTSAISNQIGAYFSLMDSAQETYDAVYKAAREAGLGEEAAAKAAAEYQSAMAEWTLEVERIKFQRMVFLDNLLFQIRAANNENAAISAEQAAKRAVEAWAKAREILDDPYVQEILGDLKLPPMPKSPYVSVGSGGGGGGGGGGGKSPAVIAFEEETKRLEDAVKAVSTILGRVLPELGGQFDDFFSEFGDKLNSVFPAGFSSIRKELESAFGRVEYNPDEALQAVTDLGIATPYEAEQDEEGKEIKAAETPEEFAARVKGMFGSGSLYSVSLDQRDLANWARQLDVLERGGLNVNTVYDNMSDDIRVGMIDAAIAIGTVPEAMSGLLDVERERLRLLIDTGNATDDVVAKYEALSNINLSNLTVDQRILAEGFGALLTAMGADIPETLQGYMSKPKTLEENNQMNDAAPKPKSSGSPGGEWASGPHNTSTTENPNWTWEMAYEREIKEGRAKGFSTWRDWRVAHLDANPGLAAGGPVVSGSTYWVGEEGPELFTPNESGEIISNDNIPGKSTGEILNMPAWVSQMITWQLRFLYLPKIYLLLGSQFPH